MDVSGRDLKDGNGDSLKLDNETIAIRSSLKTFDNTIPEDDSFFLYSPLEYTKQRAMMMQQADIQQALIENAKSSSMQIHKGKDRSIIDEGIGVRIDNFAFLIENIKIYLDKMLNT